MSSDGSEYVSNHDRGAFGKLLAEARALGLIGIVFDVDFEATDEEQRWGTTARTRTGEGEVLSCGPAGRTGEEALRRLVEKLRG